MDAVADTVVLASLLQGSARHRRLAARYLLGNARHVAGVAGDYWRRGRHDSVQASA